MDTITSLFIVYRYDSTSGTFTVPPGGDGFYYFSIYFYRFDRRFTVPPGGDGFYYFSVFLTVPNNEWGRFDIQINVETLCTAATEQEDTPNDHGQAACSAATYASAGLLVSTINIT